MWPVDVFDTSIQYVFFPVFASFAIIYLSIHIFRIFMIDAHLRVNKNIRHSWASIDSLSRACYCSICEALLMEGFFCDCCGVCVDTGCIKIADKTLTCKVTSLPNDKGPMKHHWVKGNVSLGALCDVCEEDFNANEPGLLDSQCCWCQRSVHSSCLPKLGNVCDFGSFRNYIVPPQSIELIGRRASVSNRLRINQVKRPACKDWSPIIVLANRNSGNNDGGLVLSMFRRVLNPVQVIDLSVLTPEVALEWCSLVEPNVTITFLVAGGDGTVAWVLNTMHKMKVKTRPVVGVIPLGTGNDLARVLGFGKAFTPADNNASSVLEMVQKAEIVPLDRWSVSITPQKHILPLSSNKSLFMYDYLSVGVDAQVTLNFHRTRESPFYIFSSRLFNKVLYMLFGTQQVMERMYQDLDKRIELYLDGERKDLPSIESIVVLNIPSWGAGVNLWSMCVDENPYLPEQCFSDGKLEVVAVYSSFHIAQLQVGLSQPHCIGQAKHVKIKLKAKSAVQVDGEPWVQNPCEINVTFNSRADVLSISNETALSSIE